MNRKWSKMNKIDFWLVNFNFVQKMFSIYIIFVEICLALSQIPINEILKIPIGLRSDVLSAGTSASLVKIVSDNFNLERQKSLRKIASL